MSSIRQRGFTYGHCWTHLNTGIVLLTFVLYHSCLIVRRGMAGGCPGCLDLILFSKIWIQRNLANKLESIQIPTNPHYCFFKKKNPLKISGLATPLQLHQRKDNPTRSIKPTDFLGERILGEVSSDEPTVQRPVDGVVIVVAGAVGVGEDGEG